MTQSAGRPLVILVGAGLMGRWHGHAIERVGSRVAAVVDLDGERADRLASRHKGARVFSSVSAALSSVDAAIVHVCSPSATHTALVSEAIEAGRHVLVEKPLAPDADRTSALLGQARAKGVLLAPVHQFAFQPGVRRLARERARLRDVQHVRCVACSAGAEGRPEANSDRVAGEILPHFLALVPLFAPVGPSEVDWVLSRPRAGEWHIAGQAGGVGVSFTISMGGRPTRTALEVVGSGATGHADLFHGFSIIESGDVSRARKILRPFALASGTLIGAAANLARRTTLQQPAYPGLRELVRDFHRSARSGHACPITPDETLAVAEARDRIIAQAGPPAR